MSALTRTYATPYPVYNQQIVKFLFGRRYYFSYNLQIIVVKLFIAYYIIAHAIYPKHVHFYAMNHMQQTIVLGDLTKILYV